MDDHLVLLKSLADSTRLKLLKLILHDELCVCELQEILKVSQPAVSQHIAKLKSAGLVQERRAGMWTYYRGDLQRVGSSLLALKEFLEADPGTSPVLSEELTRKRAFDRIKICHNEEGVNE